MTTTGSIATERIGVGIAYAISGLFAMAANRNFHGAGFPGSGDEADRWQDILLAYQALADPQEALRGLANLGPDYEPEFGSTHTHTRQWIGALRELGTFEPDLTADHATVAAFRKGAVRTYVVFNSTAKPHSVRFSNGVKINAPPGLHTIRK